MGVLRFDGVDDRLRWTTLASALGNVGDGAWTLACVMKRASASAPHTISIFDSASYVPASFAFGPSNDLYVYSGATPNASHGAATFTTGPYMFAVSKASGSSAPRLGYKTGVAGGWTHENFNTALADRIAATILEIGSYQTFDYMDGWIGVVAWWEGAMSDVNKEALDNNWRTSDMWNSAHGQPVFLAELNVAGASVVDQASNASGFTATGTTLDAAETLDSWSFNGTGAAIPSLVMPPLAA